MLTKYGISPWSDTSRENITLQQKQINIGKTEPLKSKNKMLKLSERCMTENQFIVARKKNKKKPNKFKLASKSLSKSTNNSDFISKIQTSTISIKQRMSKKLSTQLFIPSSKFQVNLSSQRIKTLESQSISLYEKTSQLHKSSLQNNSNHQSMPYFFSLIQKKNIKFNKQKNKYNNQQYRTPDQNDIFKKVDQISIKRKHQIKLPKISVAYSRVQQS